MSIQRARRKLGPRHPRIEGSPPVRMWFDSEAAEAIAKGESRIGRQQTRRMAFRLAFFEVSQANKSYSRAGRRLLARRLCQIRKER